MKKLRFLLFVALALCCLTISVGALDLSIDLDAPSQMEAQITSAPDFTLPDTGISTLRTQPRSDDGSILPADTAYNATFVKDSMAKVSFIVSGCRSDRYFFALVMDEAGEKEYAKFTMELSKINSTPDQQHVITLKIDLAKYKIPVGDHIIAFGIVDANGNPVNEYFDVLDFSVVAKEIPLTSITFYDVMSGPDINRITLCPKEDNLYGLIYNPSNATGAREPVFQSSNEKIFTVSSFGGYFTIETVGAGTATLTATVNDKVTASIPVTVGHDYSLSKTDREPTCTQDGQSTYRCLRCGETETRKTPALGHNFGNNKKVITKEATACIPGQAETHCDRCNKGITEVIAPVFYDTDANRFYTAAVDYFYKNGIIMGIDKTHFGTETPLNRGMLVTFLYRMAGKPVTSAKPPFTDVESGRYYTDAIAWAYESGIAKGVTATTFDPMADITRQQLAAFIYRYAQYKGLDVSASADLSRFPDASQLQSYAKPNVAWAVSAGIISGTTDENGKAILSPEGSATRAQAATMLYRYLTFEENQSNGAAG